MALIATERLAECETLMEALLTDPSAQNWVPNPMLAVHMIQTRRSRGHAEQAAALAMRSARQYPENGDLFYLELTTRIVVTGKTRTEEGRRVTVDVTLTNRDGEVKLAGSAVVAAT